ncbi:uncharacterized protein LOC144907398 [Branchiostoma floridae x Branchiostoma belcheri]
MVDVLHGTSHVQHDSNRSKYISQSYWAYIHWRQYNSYSHQHWPNNCGQCICCNHSDSKCHNRSKYSSNYSLRRQYNSRFSHYFSNLQPANHINGFWFKIINLCSNSIIHAEFIP